MNLVLVSAEACGYYSDARWEEYHFIKKETYDIIKEDIQNLEIVISELDGKHSECDAYIDCEEYLSNTLENSRTVDCDVKDVLYDNLSGIYRKYNLDLNKEKIEIKKYLDTLDNYVTKSFSLRKSEIKAVTEFIRKLRREKNG